MPGGSRQQAARQHACLPARPDLLSSCSGRQGLSLPYASSLPSLQCRAVTARTYSSTKRMTTTTCRAPCCLIWSPGGEDWGRQ